MRRRLLCLALLVGAPWLFSLAGGAGSGETANEITEFTMALAAAMACCRACLGSRGAGRLVWGSFTLGAALSAAAQGWYLVAKWQGADLLAASPVLYAAWASLYYLAFVGFYVTAFLRPHQPGGQGVRPALVLDMLLLAQLLLATHFYLLVSYRLGSGGWDRRAGSLALTAVLGLGAGVLLWRCRAKAAPGLWRRRYGMLAPAALALAANEAIYICLRDARGAVADSHLPWSVAADQSQIVAFALLLLSADATSEVPVARPPSTGLPRASAWRDLAVPAAVLMGLLGVPLLDSVFSAAALLSAGRFEHRNAVGMAGLGVYIVLVLVRQLLIQIENRALSATLYRESSRLKLLLDSIQDAVVTEDPKGGIIFANDRFFELFGLPRSRAGRLRLADCIHPDDRPRADDTSSDPSLVARFEFRGVRQDGTVLYLESSRAPVRQDDVLVGFQSVIRDITERRNIELQQRELAQRLEFLVSNMPLGMIVFDLDFRVLEWNQSAERIFGWSAAEALGRNGLQLLVSPELWPSLTGLWQELAASSSANHRFNQNLTKDGRVIDCEWFNTTLINETGHAVAVASMVQDLTERRSLEAQLRQAQKMEVVGTLAGGIAHDFNNLLTPILGYVALARMRLGPNHPAGRGLADAEKAAERAAELVRQLLGFSRKGPSVVRPLSLRECVRDTVALMRRTLDPRIRIEVLEPPELWMVEADPTQVNQVLANLCVNARDAMPDGGQLTLSLLNRSLDPEDCRRQPDARPGEFVELSVADTGTGIDAATLPRIFEPFFTTKGVGEGTGLGLAMVYGIVHQLEGWIRVESHLGQGSTFSIFLPRSSRAHVRPKAEPLARLAGGSEIILLVEDDEMILKLTRGVLENRGHRVLEARDGEEGIQVFHEFGRRIDLIILDLILPRKSGRDTLAELHRLAPGVPVLVTSGYRPTETMEELAALGVRAMLPKPYTPVELIQAIRRLLDSATPAPAEIGSPRAGN